MTETWLNGGDLSFVDYLQREVNKKMQIQILFRLFRHPIENRSNSTLDYQNQFPLKLFLWPQRAIWLLFHFHKPEKTREENMKHEGTMKILSLTKILRNSPAGNYEELNWFLPHLEFQWKAAYFSECCWWYPKNKTKIREVIIHMYTDAMFILQRLEIKSYSNFLLGHSKWTPLLPARNKKKMQMSIK